MLKLKTNKTSGITLISLVVTIIVLLLLAGISIMMLTGNNGILQRTSDAKEQMIVGQEKESVELAYITAAMKKLGDDITANELQDELDAMLGDTEETDETKKKTNVKQNSNNTINVLFRETQHNYNVNQGNVTKALEDGLYIDGKNIGFSRLVSYNDTICVNLYNNYQNALKQSVTEKFGENVQEEDIATDPDFIRIVREETNNYIDTLVGYIDNQEIKNLLLSYKTNEGYSRVGVSCRVSGDSVGGPMYSGDVNVDFDYTIYFRLDQFNTENKHIKKDIKSLQICGHFELGGQNAETGDHDLLLDKNFYGVMEDNDDVIELSNDIKFVLNNVEYSNAAIGITKYIMESIGVEDDFNELDENYSYERGSETVDCYRIYITDEDAERIEQAFQN